MPLTPAQKLGRGGRRYRALQRWVYATKIVCCLCGEPVDMTLCWPDPRSKSMQHLTDLALGGAPLSKSNVDLAHLTCNSSAGAKMGNNTLIVRSSRW
jgi:hypothetical protein